MLRYLNAADLKHCPHLEASMFRDRAHQFAERLKWDVRVDADGFERDEYDDLNPLYVIWQRPDGSHGGSMRFLPTTGPTMARDHFSHLQGNADLQSPFIWESTRFCLAPGSTSQIAAGVMLGAAELMRAFSLDFILGIFDARMVRIYSRAGIPPEVLASSGDGHSQISLGLWPYTDYSRFRLRRGAGVSSDLSEAWFARSFGHAPRPETTPRRRAA